MKKLKQILSHRITKISFFVFLCLFGWFQYISSKQVGYQITFYNSIEYGYYGLFGNKTIRLEGNPDVKTFMVLKHEDFAKDKSNVWYQHYLLKDADLATFEATNFYFNSGHTYYSKDKNHIWCGESLLQDADPITFMQLAASSAFTKDKNNVYHGEKLLEEADPATFVLLDDGSNNGGVSGFYAKDKKAVYYFNEKIPQADAATFQNIKASAFSKDKNHVYYFEKLLPEADVNTFDLLEKFSNLAKDKNHVFKEDKILPDVKPEAYPRVILGHYQKDKIHIYFDNKPLLKADFASFQLLEHDDAYAKDYKNVYHLDQIVEKADATTFQRIPNTLYSKDKNHVYWHGFLLEKADVVTFKVNEKGQGFDKNGLVER